MSQQGPGSRASSDPDDGAAPDESGYRRDDYWRQQQSDLPPDAGTDGGKARDFEPVDDRVDKAVEQDEGSPTPDRGP